jgi:hypothetical protein
MLRHPIQTVPGTANVVEVDSDAGQVLIVSALRHHADKIQAVRGVDVDKCCLTNLDVDNSFGKGRFVSALRHPILAVRRADDDTHPNLPIGATPALYALVGRRSHEARVQSCNREA